MPIRTIERYPLFKMLTGGCQLAKMEQGLPQDEMCPLEEHEVLSSLAELE